MAPSDVLRFNVDVKELAAACASSGALSWGWAGLYAMTGSN